MNLAYHPSVSSQQRQWVADALASLRIPLTSFIAGDVLVQTVADPASPGHNDAMATSIQEDGSYLIEIREGLDTGGVPGIPGSLQDFFVECFIHELGHVIAAQNVSSDPARTTLAATLTRTSPVGSVGQRGTLADWSGHAWGENIQEGLAEVLKDAATDMRLYDNRSNWTVTAEDWDAFSVALGLRVVPSDAPPTDDPPAENPLWTVDFEEDTDESYLGTPVRYSIFNGRFEATFSEDSDSNMAISVVSNWVDDDGDFPLAIAQWNDDGLHLQLHGPVLSSECPRPADRKITVQVEGGVVKVQCGDVVLAHTYDVGLFTGGEDWSERAGLRAFVYGGTMTHVRVAGFPGGYHGNYVVSPRRLVGTRSVTSELATPPSYDHPPMVQWSGGTMTVFVDSGAGPQTRYRESVDDDEGLSHTGVSAVLPDTSGADLLAAYPLASLFEWTHTFDNMNIHGAVVGALSSIEGNLFIRRGALGGQQRDSDAPEDDFYWTTSDIAFVPAGYIVRWPPSPLEYTEWTAEDAGSAFTIYATEEEASTAIAEWNATHPFVEGESPATQPYIFEYHTVGVAMCEHEFGGTMVCHDDADILAEGTRHTDDLRLVFGFVGDADTTMEGGDVVSTMHAYQTHEDLHFVAPPLPGSEPVPFPYEPGRIDVHDGPTAAIRIG